MNPFDQTGPFERRLIGIAALIAIIPIFAAAASAQQSTNGPTSYRQTPAGAVTHPAEIDRVVAEFTGSATGEIGGARVPADRRLRLAACATPLDVEWYGRNRTTVQVSCSGPEYWRIFIATRAAPQNIAGPQEPIVSRGDPITVVVRGNGFSVQQSGEAIENGAIGDWIGIRTNRNATPIRARIERPGLAVIPVG